MTKSAWQRREEASLLSLVDSARTMFIWAGYDKISKVRVMLRDDIDTWDEGERTVACCLSDGHEIWLSPRLIKFGSFRQAAIIAHEFGHAVQALYTGFPKGHDATERGADLVAEQVYRAKIYYAPIQDDPRQRLLQTFQPVEGAIRPRPAGLR